MGVMEVHAAHLPRAAAPLPCRPTALHIFMSCVHTAPCQHRCVREAVTLAGREKWSVSRASSSRQIGGLMGRWVCAEHVCDLLLFMRSAESILLSSSNVSSLDCPGGSRGEALLCAGGRCWQKNTGCEVLPVLRALGKAAVPRGRSSFPWQPFVGLQLWLPHLVTWLPEISLLHLPNDYQDEISSG